MVGESDKDDNQKPAAKKRLQDNNDVYQGTTTRAKKMRLENHAIESKGHFIGVVGHQLRQKGKMSEVRIPLGAARDFFT